MQIGLVARSVAQLISMRIKINRAGTRVSLARMRRRRTATAPHWSVAKGGRHHDHRAQDREQHETADRF